MKELIKWAAIGLGAYWVYETYFATPAAATTTTTTTTPATTTPATTTPVTTTTPATPAFNSLAAIYTRMVADAVANVAGSTASTITLTADQWNFYLARQSSITPAAPGTVFGATYQANPSALMTPAQYWNVMEPYLVTQGMSGLGLYRGMGRFYQRRRFA
jgi:hypothetical protein